MSHYSKLMPNIHCNKFIKWRWLILLIFPIGWWLTIDYFRYSIPESNKFSDLTIISFAASCLVLYKLKGEIAKELHLWSIYLILLIGHYVKFYLMMYWYHLNSSHLEIFSKLVIFLLSSPKIVIEAYTVATIALCAFASALCLTMTISTKSLLPHQRIQQFNQSRFKFQHRRWIIACGIIWVVISAVILFLYTDLRVNARVDTNGLGGTILKYKLGGILTYSNRLLIPAVFLMLIFLADTFNDRTSSIIIVTAYFVQVALFGFISTSKASIPSAMISLAILWALSGHFTPVRRTLFLAGLTLLPFIFGLTMILRSMREVGEVGHLINLPVAIEVLLSDRNPVLSNSQFTFITRFNGIDTLLPIVKYNPSLNMDKTLEFLQKNDFSVNELYSREVIGYPDVFGVGFSPGLTGCFYLLSGNQIFLGVLIFLYTLLWHILFRYVSNRALVIQPLAITQVSLMAAFTTSEGSINLLPYQLFISLVVIAVGEFSIRFFMQISIVHKKSGSRYISNGSSF